MYTNTCTHAHTHTHTHLTPHRESEWIRIQTTSARKTMMLGQIKMATHNLSTLMYKHLHRRIPSQEADQTLLQLDKVSRHLRVFSMSGTHSVYSRHPWDMIKDGFVLYVLKSEGCLLQWTNSTGTPTQYVLKDDGCLKQYGEHGIASYYTILCHVHCMYTA